MVYTDVSVMRINYFYRTQLYMYCFNNIFVEFMSTIVMMIFVEIRKKQNTCMVFYLVFMSHVKVKY